MERYSDSEAAYKIAIQINPNYVDTHNSLGNFLSYLKRYTEPESAYAHNGLGNLLSKMERYPESEAAYKMAIEIDPPYASAKTNLDKIHSKLSIVINELGQDDFGVRVAGKVSALDDKSLVF